MLDRNTTFCALITLVVLITLLLIPAVADFGIAGASPAVADLLRYLATQIHFEPMLKGLVDTADLAYFAFVIGSSLLITKAVVESVRWR